MLKHASEYHVLPKIEYVNAETGLDFQHIGDISSNPQDAFLDEIEEFCKNRALADAVLASADLIDRGIPEIQCALFNAKQTVFVCPDIGQF